MASPPSAPVEGYPKLACHMGRYAQSAIYRRFGSLNSQNILYMQAELVHLEKRLRNLQDIDASSNQGHRSKISKDWYWLNNYASEEGSEQWEAVLTIRQKLKDYNDAIIQQSVMNNLADPSSHALTSLQQWMERPGMGNRALIGKDSDVWGTSDEPLPTHSDLLTVCLHGIRDSFSTWYTDYFVHWIHKLFWHRLKKVDDPESGIISYEESVLEKYTSHITTIIASLLPIVAIAVLYCVGSMKTRLGLVSLFTFMFSTALSFFTNARRGEIFVATSTFAAVQVVFIATGNEGGILAG
ncbi:hypothetical protein VTL71DRAFT_13091 [Oculimacula yallundae]|uniref:DUF6594 domain-containing protein n=1 Tax=Oculimacula yallundae TaxID=86028 RepID=A0ABR4CR39_9HELO